MDLAVQKRSIIGKKTRMLRKQGLLPAELYGRGVSNEHIVVVEKDFKKIFRQVGENTLFYVVLDDKKIPVLVHDVKYHPVTDLIEAIDFYQVKLDEKLRTKVPVEFIGESPAVKDKKCILVKAMQEIEVEALPSDIPHSFTVNLSKLIDVNQSFYVRDLEIPKNVKLLVELTGVVATVKPQMTEEEEKALEEQAVPSVENVVVETEEKKAERLAKEAAIGPTENSTPATPKK